MLAPASGTWVDAVSVELVDGQGNPTGIQAQPFAGPDKASATLNKDMVAGGLWRFKSGATSALAPGTYAIRARLAIAGAAPGSQGWTGTVSADDISLKIAAPSDVPKRHAQHALASAQEAILDGRLEDAAAGIDALLVEQRDKVDAWTLRAVVAERAGNIFAALQCVNEAQTRYLALNIGEPDLELHAMTRRLMKAMEEAPNAAAISAPRGHWSWPPKELLTEPDPSPFIPTSSTSDSPSPSPSPPAANAPSSGKDTAQGPDAPSSAAPVDKATVVPVAETNESDYLNDPRGQWAVSATASSEYGKDRYDAAKATGAPNVTSYSDNPNAWCHSGASRQEEWLDLEFSQPVRAGELRVRQSYTPGTLSKVEAFAANGRGQILWEGTDPNTYPKGQISWFVLRFPPPEFPVQRVKLTLSIARVPGWKQIDAVQLVGDAP